MYVYLMFLAVHLAAPLLVLIPMAAFAITNLEDRYGKEETRHWAWNSGSRHQPVWMVFVIWVFWPFFLGQIYDSLFDAVDDFHEGHK